MKARKVEVEYMKARLIAGGSNKVAAKVYLFKSVYSFYPFYSLYCKRVQYYGEYCATMRSKDNRAD